MITRYWGIDPHPLCSGINWQGKEPTCRTSVCLDKSWTQLPLFLRLNAIWKLVEFRKRHNLRPPLSSFPPFSDPHLWKCQFSSTLGLQELNFWADKCWVILPSPATGCLKHLGSETTCAGTVLLHALPEWTVKMFLTHIAMRCFVQLPENTASPGRVFFGVKVAC